MPEDVLHDAEPGLEPVATAKSVHIRELPVGTPCQVMVVGKLRNPEEGRIVSLVRIDKHLRRSLAVLENDGIARQRARIRKPARFQIFTEAGLNGLAPSVYMRALPQRRYPDERYCSQANVIIRQNAEF